MLALRTAVELEALDHSLPHPCNVEEHCQRGRNADRASSPSATPTQFGRFVAVRVHRRGSVVDTAQPNFQLRKGEAASGEATSVTCEPAGNGAVHVGGQAIPLGSLVMLPVPFPPRITRTSSGVKRATRDESRDSD